MGYGCSYCCGVVPPWVFVVLIWSDGKFTASERTDFDGVDWYSNVEHAPCERIELDSIVFIRS